MNLQGRNSTSRSPAVAPARRWRSGPTPARQFAVAGWRAWVGLILLFLASLPAVLAAPRVWVEARLEPPEIPVNAQATYVLRFAHAVDVRALRIAPPVARLAEILALGPVVSSELQRDGVRYRVREQRFAVLPFASGELVLESSVGGETPAALAEFGGKAKFSLPAPPLRLLVRPAAVAPDWLPAKGLQISFANATLPTLRVGEVWSRQLLIEADGVDGSVIAPPRWSAAAEWSLQFDPAEVGRRIDGGRVIGYRRQTIHAQVLGAGKLDFPLATVGWWPLPAGPWRESVSAAASIEVAAAPSATAEQFPPPKGAGDRPGSSKALWFALLSAVAILLAVGGLLTRSPAGDSLRRVWQRRLCWQNLDAACRVGDAPAARCALLAWAAASGWPVRSLGAFGEASRESRPPLANAIAGLEAACYGRPGERWNGQPLRAALRDAIGLGPYFGGAALRLSSRPVAFR